MLTRLWVVELQQILKTRGYFLGNTGPAGDGVDGDMGDRTLFGALMEIKKTVEALVSPAPGKPDVLKDTDYALAAAALDPLATSRLIKAVKQVESVGGWFTDVRADILAQDGPGGFIDGVWLPKILFEAHEFHKRTGGRYDATAPNLSSPTWNRALYVGGQAEYVRLYKAMQLDRTAALESASVGMFQIMGYNHKLAGYDDLEEFWSAMKQSEAKQLKAFVMFVRNSRMTQKLLLVAKGNGAPFAEAYNGPGYKQNHYDTKLVEAYRNMA